MLPTIRHRFAVLAIAIAAVAGTTPSEAQVLQGNIFRTGFENWIDTWDPNTAPSSGSLPNWGVLLTGDKFLLEASDGIGGSGTTTDGVSDGGYIPYAMINNANVTPANYTLDFDMATVDNDGLGVIFGYQDPDNYFRVGLRSQSPSNLGFETGTSVQKVVNGVTTQIYSDTFVDHSIDGSTFDVSVAVNGSNITVTTNGFTHPLITDGDLQPGKYGVHSWAQKQNSSSLPQYGTMVHQVSVTSSTLNDTTTFSDAVVAEWRRLDMLNNEGTGGQAGEDFGNFRQDFRYGTIVDDTNGFEYATDDTNVDFIGPAVVIDEAGSSAWTDYRFNVRMQNTDNDGIGALFRVADDDSFYRINFTNEGMGANTTTFRAPRGMSIQKNDNGVWSEVFRDDQSNPKFVYGVGTPFDVSVSVIGDTINVQVIDDPEGTPEVINYDPIVDSGTTLLSGSVGLTNWGSGDGNLNVSFSSYAGDEDAPFVSAISEIPDVGLVVDRTTGAITLQNNGSVDLDVSGYLLASNASVLDPANWTEISGNYDEVANGGDGSVDSDDTWTIVTSTAAEFREEELSGGDGGVLQSGVPVDLGTPWMQSSIEDILAVVQLTDGSLIFADVEYINGPGGNAFSRTDLNVDGVISAADFDIFFENALTDISGLTLFEQALLGDVNGDGFVDVEDFTLMKVDVEAAFGPGALGRMLGNVPEPSAVAMLLLGAIAAVGFRLRTNAQLWLPKLLAVVAVLGVCTVRAEAQPLDLTTFTEELYPLAATFPEPEWVVSPVAASHAVNGSPSVLFSSGSAYNKRFLGRLTPGTDDDVVGFVLGFEAGDATRGSADVANADYLLIDWKGTTQTFNFGDTDPEANFNSGTDGGEMPLGLALSRVTGGVPTADEMWQHADLDTQEGQVAEITRATVSGSAAYPRDGSSVLVDIRYSPTNVTVLVDGVEEFNENGSFPDGSFGFYSAHQGPTPVFSGWNVVPDNFTGLSVEVNRANGEITMTNDSASPMDFDYYSFESEGLSLVSTVGQNQWESFNSGESDGPGEGWQEAGGADASQIAEYNFQSATTVAGNSSVTIGNAYNTSINAEDLVFTYRLPGSGLVLEGTVTYVGVVGEGLSGDFNDDGLVDAADYTVWRNNLGAQTEAVLNDNGSGNGVVDIDDYALWKSNFGAIAPGALTTPIASVPEPSSLLIVMGIAIAGLATCRRVNG